MLKKEIRFAAAFAELSAFPNVARVPGDEIDGQIQQFLTTKEEIWDEDGVLKGVSRRINGKEKIREHEVTGEGKLKKIEGGGRRLKNRTENLRLKEEREIRRKSELGFEYGMEWSLKLGG